MILAQGKALSKSSGYVQATATFAKQLSPDGETPIITVETTKT